MEAGHHRHHREEKTTMVWPHQKDAREENNKIYYGMDTRVGKEMWMEVVQATMKTRNLEPDQWRNREEWHLVYGKQRQLL
jgi:hypothetical protein